jgi:hypothetical protein
MSNLFQIELDIAGRDNFLTDTEEWAKKFDCKAELVQLIGPAGGNPLFRFIGSKGQLLRLIMDYQSGMGDDFLYEPTPYARIN